MEKFLKRSRCAVPSVAIHPYIQDDYYILRNAAASAIDGITACQ